MYKKKNKKRRKKKEKKRSLDIHCTRELTPEGEQTGDTSSLEVCPADTGGSINCGAWESTPRV